MQEEDLPADLKEKDQEIENQPAMPTNLPSLPKNKKNVVKEVKKSMVEAKTHLS